jgi:hypothetical protein
MALQSLDCIGPPAKSAVPALVDLLKASPPRAGVRPDFIISILGNIGSNAAPAIPDVQRWFDQEANVDHKCTAATALFRMDSGQTNALNFLLSCLTNNDPTIIKGVVVHDLGEIGPNAKAAVPYLLEVIKGTDFTTITEVPSALTHIGVGSDVILSALKEHLKSRDEGLRIGVSALILDLAPADRDAQQVLMNAIRGGSGFEDFAINALGNTGPAASNAIPILRGVVRDGTRPHRDAARQALRRIERNR